MMLKKILDLESAQQITKLEQKNISGGIPECWIYAIEAGCILMPIGEICPLDTMSGICDSKRLCC